MADPVYITKGAVVGAFLGAGILLAFDRLFPTMQQRERRVIKHLKYKSVALDVDPELMRLLLSLQQYEPYNPDAYESAFGRMDSVYKIFKLLYTDPHREAQAYDYSVAWMHYKKGMEALRELYEAVRMTEIDLFEQRAQAKAKLQFESENRRRRRNAEAALENQRLEPSGPADEKLASVVLQCDAVEKLIASVMDQVDVKLDYINARVVESLSSPELYHTAEGAESTEEPATAADEEYSEEVMPPETEL